jgi:serine/threonine protein kinase
MEANLAPSTNLLALPDGTELVGDYRIKRVLGAGGFGITYLADETALGRLVTIKEYFPAEFAARHNRSAVPRSRGVREEYKWGLDRFIEEAQTLARFDHPNIVRVHRYFRANETGYMVLKFEEGGSFKAWLKGLKRPPRQTELDRMIAPLLDALEIIHDADFLHRDIAPDNIMVRKDGSPVLIDFGSARGALASQSRTVSALVKPGYSPYEQYATSGANQGPWTDIYALGATLYHAITGRRPPDAPSRVVNDEYVPAHQAAPGTYRSTFLEAIDKALRIEVAQRPQRIAEWRGLLLGHKSKGKASRGVAALASPRTLLGRLGAAEEPHAGASLPTQRAAPEAAAPRSAMVSVPASLVPTPPDAPQRKGQLLDFIDALRRHGPAVLGRSPAAPAPAPTPAKPPASAAGAGEVAERAAPKVAQKAPQAAVPPTEPAMLPPPRVLRRDPAKPRRSWAVRRWGKGTFRVAMAVLVSCLAVAYEQSGKPSASSVSAVPGEARSAGFILQLVGHRGPVVAVATTVEDQWIVSAGADASIRVWSARSGEPRKTINLPEGAATALAVDEQRALVGHQDGAVALWDLESGKKLATFQYGHDPITSVAFLGDRLVAARRDGGIALLDSEAPQTAAVMLETQDSGSHLVAAARSRGLLVSAGPDRTVRLWKGRDPQLVRTYRLTSEGAAIDIARDASYLAGASVDGVVRFQRSPGLRSPYLHAVQTFKAHDGRVTAIALGPSGVLASAGQDGSLKLWALHPQRLMRALDAGRVRSLSFSRDGQRLMAGDQDGVVRVWAVGAPPGAGAL